MTARIASIFVSSTAVRIHDLYILTVIYSPLGGFIWNHNNNHLPVGLLAHFVEHCTGIAGFKSRTGLNFFQALFSLLLKLCQFITEKIASILV